jgi:hypothetical protein
MRTYKYPQKQSRIGERMMFVGIQAEEGHNITEESILAFFTERGLFSDEEHIMKEGKKFSYFSADKANYTIFKEINDLDFFTENVIDFLTAHPHGKITVQDEYDGENEFLYIGNIKQFLKVWRNDLDGE